MEATPRTLRKWHPQDLDGRTRRSAASGPLGPRRDNNHNRGPPWPIYVAVFIVQFFIPGVLVSHGVYLSHILYQENHRNPFQVVWPPTFFLATWCASKPLFRFLGMRHQGADCRVLAACGTLILAVGLATSSITHSTFLRSLTFGLLGGIGCSLVTSQCDVQLSLHFRPSIGLCLKGIALSLGHFASPLIMMALVSSYGTAGAPLVQAAVALHGLAGALLFTKKNTKFKKKNSASPTQEIEEDDEVIYSQVSTEVESGERSSNLRRWKNPSSDTVDGLQTRHNFLDDDDDEDAEESVFQRPRNHMGVEIMPLILEEEEDDEDGDVMLEFAQKRLSRIRSVARDSWAPAAPLDLYQSDQLDSTVDGNSPMALLTPSSLSGESRTVFNFNATANRSKSSGREFFTRKWEAIQCFVKNVWHKSLIPSLLINASQSLVQLSTAAVVPMVANQVITFRRHEGAFSMAVMGFGWLCICICTPCFLMPVVKRQRGVILSATFLLSSIGFSLLSVPRSHDRLTLGCIAVGMTYGAISNLTPAIHHALWGSATLGDAVQNVIDVGTSAILILCVFVASCFIKTVEDFSGVFAWMCYMQIAVGVAALVWTFFQRAFRKYKVWELSRHQNVV